MNADEKRQVAMQNTQLNEQVKGLQFALSEYNKAVQGWKSTVTKNRQVKYAERRQADYPFIENMATIIGVIGALIFDVLISMLTFRCIGFPFFLYFILLAGLSAGQITGYLAYLILGVAYRIWYIDPRTGERGWKLREGNISIKSTENRYDIFIERKRIYSIDGGRIWFSPDHIHLFNAVFNLVDRESQILNDRIQEYMEQLKEEEITYADYVDALVD